MSSNCCTSASPTTSAEKSTSAKNMESPVEGSPFLHVHQSVFDCIFVTHVEEHVEVVE